MSAPSPTSLSSLVAGFVEGIGISNMWVLLVRTPQCNITLNSFRLDNLASLFLSSTHTHTTGEMIQSGSDT